MHLSLTSTIAQFLSCVCRINARDKVKERDCIILLYIFKYTYLCDRTKEIGLPLI